MIVRNRALILNSDGDILLVKHPNRGDWWCLPGGKIEDGELSHDAMVRELKEELDMEGEKPRLRFISEVPHIHSLEFLYIVEVQDESFMERTGSHDHELEEKKFFNLKESSVLVKPEEIREMLQRRDILENRIDHIHITS